MAHLEKKNFSAPDQTTPASKAKIEIIEVGDKTIRRSIFEPGWKWSTDYKEMMGTDVCTMHHLGYVESGTIHVRTEDGQELEVTEGDVANIPPGHDAWVVGNEPAVFIDFAGSPGPKLGASK